MNGTMNGYLFDSSNKLSLNKEVLSGYGKEFRTAHPTCSLKPKLTV